jgi:choice-of-anchor A domain-containing protein
MSEQLRDLGPTGQTALAGGTLRLAGTGASLEVFQVTAAQFAGAQAIVLVDVAPEAHLVINVDADATSRLTFGLDTAALSAWKGRVLVNAHDAEIVTFSGQTLWSSLLAPVACVCNGTGRIEGSVVARKWTSAVSVSYTPFVPKN